MKRNMRKLVSVLFAAVCCVASLQSCVKDKKDEVKEYVKVGDPVPSFPVQGRVFTSADFEGKSSLIVFFTAECPNCKDLMPIVDAAWQEIDGNDDFQIVAVARESSASAVDGLWAAKGMTIPYFRDPDRSAFSKFANMNVPRLYLVDANGIILWKKADEAGITKQYLLDLMDFRVR